MDNRTILAVVLSLVVWYGWLYLKQEELPEDETVALVEPVEETPAVPVLPVHAEAKTVPFAACDAHGKVSTIGGAVSDLVLTDHQGTYAMQPIYTWLLGKLGGEAAEWAPYGPDPGPARLLSPDGRAFTVSAGGQMPVMEVVRQERGMLALHGRSPEGVDMTWELSEVATEPCHLSLTVTWNNQGDRTFTGGLGVGVHDALHAAASRYESTMHAEAYVDEELWQLTDPTDEDEAIEGPVGWFGLADTYFALLAVPTDGGGAVAGFDRLPAAEGDHRGVTWTLDAPMPAGTARAETFAIYLGPKDHERLSAIDPSLDETIVLGWFSFFATPLLHLLRFFHTLSGNWGAAIILLTVAVKAVFFPLTQMSFKSTQGMQAIQPQVKALQEKYKDSPEELNRKMLELWQENGVNPMGGCLPMLVQMPVWFALYSVLLSSVELYHTEFLYLKDLSAIDPYAALPTIVVGLMLIQQQLTPMGNMDPAQAQMMKYMPLMFGFFFYGFPSGLVLYIFVNMLLTILQQWYIKKTFQGSPPPAAAAAV